MSFHSDSPSGPPHTLQRPRHPRNTVKNTPCGHGCPRQHASRGENVQEERTQAERFPKCSSTSARRKREAQNRKLWYFYLVL